MPSCFACFTSSARAGISVSLRRYNTYAGSAPSRRADRIASSAVFPPPITATCFPRSPIIGSSYRGNSYACIRLIRVRNSLAEYTPFRCSPGMFRNTGNPAPVATKTASYPSSSNNSSIDTVFPTTTFVSNSTPIFRIVSICSRITCFGKRNSGIPYTSTPPISCSASNTCTWWPLWIKSPAALNPAGPLPTIATFLRTNAPRDRRQHIVLANLCRRPQVVARHDQLHEVLHLHPYRAIGHARRLRAFQATQRLLPRQFHRVSHVYFREIHHPQFRGLLRHPLPRYFHPLLHGHRIRGNFLRRAHGLPPAITTGAVSATPLLHFPPFSPSPSHAR